MMMSPRARAMIDSHYTCYNDRAMMCGVSILRLSRMMRCPAAAAAALVFFAASSVLVLTGASAAAAAESSADLMARNILEWIQGIYRQGIRKTRQESNGYLPPVAGGGQRPPDKPRPFQPPPSVSPGPSSPRPTYIPQEPSTSGPPRPFITNSGSTTFIPPSRYPSPPEAGPGTSSAGYPPSLPPSSVSPGFPTPVTDSYGYPSPSSPSYPSFPTPDAGGSSSSPGGGGSSSAPPSDDDANHPPHIHDLQVKCSKTMMTIDIEFNRQFDGVIYSKGFYMMPECRYVAAENSGQTKYSFTVSLDSCGTEFINDFEGEAGQAYLENVLVLQNEVGIQEVWDTVRRVRCLWEGNINKALTVSLSVDMLNQEIVTFSGDTATAKLDIQVGKGPFAAAATGLVKIGEPMTLVVSVEGDPAFDLQVRDCVARDELSTNVVQLTDERGCILKPKLFGAFQKTKETGSTGASIIAYAFFQAFKFPDVMDLFIECNVELCKTADCAACPEANQQIDPGRRRRRNVWPGNFSSSLSEPIRMGRGFRVIMPDDLASSHAIAETNMLKNVCMSYEGFCMSFSILLAMLVVSTISAATLFIKVQKISRGKFLPNA